MSECRYEIDGITYIQRPLVFGQIKQLSALLGGVTIDLNNAAEGLLQVVGDNMPQALAIVLTPEGVRVKDKKMADLADTLEFAITAEQVVQVMDDFFTCNPVVSILNRLGQTTGIIKDLMVNWVTGLISSYASSPQVTSPGGTLSCGDITPESADTGLNTGAGTLDSGNLSSPCSEDRSQHQAGQMEQGQNEHRVSENTAVEKI